MKRSRSSTPRNLSQNLLIRDDDDVPGLVNDFVPDDYHHSSSRPEDTMENSRHSRHQQRLSIGDDMIVRNIASFMTLSDAASLTSTFIEEGTSQHREEITTPADSWAIGVEFDSYGYSSPWSITTPITPALVALSPAELPMDDDDDINLDSILRERRRRWAQEKLSCAIFAHPGSLRSFCLQAYAAAQEIRAQQERQLSLKDPETLIEVNEKRKDRRRLQVIHDLIDLLVHNVPLSVLIDVVESVGGLSLDTTLAGFHLTGATMNSIFSALVNFIGALWDTLTSFNPFHFLEAIISMQFNAMGKTSEALASGLQSVATGVGSAGSMALHRLSTANLSAARPASSSSLGGHHPRRNTVVNKTLLRKLSTINDAARVLAYEEFEDAGGLTKHAINRTRRMMHYTVSLKPFVATVAITPASIDSDEVGHVYAHQDDAESDTHSDGTESPFMCTPQSFPPTPHSRHLVMAQKSRFSEDDVFGARDRLRVHDALASQDERTREMAKALKENRILAVFDDKGLPMDIQLSCGRHIATKIGNLNYSNTRGMIPLLRNCYVYFEMTVLPHIGDVPPITMPTLSIGLSTEEMPPNTLVGAWQGSVGLCTTGQILLAGQWCSPPDPSRSCYTAGATVGCLVCLDDDSAFETWDGVMITASVTFSVNGQIVPPAKSPPLPHSHQEVKSPKEHSSSSASVDLLVPAAEDVFPTVTLQSAATSVMCRFSAEDLLAPSREMIGAPLQGPIYAVDGSVVNI